MEALLASWLGLPFALPTEINGTELGSLHTRPSLARGVLIYTGAESGNQPTNESRLSRRAFVFARHHDSSRSAGRLVVVCASFGYQKLLLCAGRASLLLSKMLAYAKGYYAVYLMHIQPADPKTPRLDAHVREILSLSLWQP